MTIRDERGDLLSQVVRASELEWHIPQFAPTTDGLSYSHSYFKLIFGEVWDGETGILLKRTDGNPLFALATGYMDTERIARLLDSFVETYKETN